MKNNFILLVFFIIAGSIFLLPVYWSIVYNPLYMLLILVSWFPAITIVKIGAFITE